MRDLALLRFTLEAIREFGDSGACVLPAGREHHGWYAGAQPLNGQAVQGLIADRWLRQSADSHEDRIDAWPGFARRTEVTAMPSEAANLIRDLRRQADLPLFGIGPLFETLDALDRLRRSDGPRTKPPS
jgi:hypothetical protein